MHICFAAYLEHFLADVAVTIAAAATVTATVAAIPVTVAPITVTETVAAGVVVVADEIWIYIKELSALEIVP